MDKIRLKPGIYYADGLRIGQPVEIVRQRDAAGRTINLIRHCRKGARS